MLTASILAPPVSAAWARPSAAAETFCELHIWPAAKSLAVIHYNPIYSGRDRAFVGIHGRLPTPKTLIASDQLTILREMVDLPVLLDLPATTTVILHEQQLKREVALAATRHTESTSQCLGELLVHAVIYESSSRVARSLRLTVTYQYFGDDQSRPNRRFTTSTKARLTQFPATSPAEVPAANTELEGAFREALVSFTKYAKNPVAE